MPPTDLKLPTAEAIERILAFLPYFESGAPDASTVGGGQEIEPGVFQMPFAFCSERVDEFMGALNDEGFVQQDFDWPSWQARAEDYFKDPELLDNAGLEDIVRLFTTHLRGERFCDGHFARMIESGHVLAVLRRSQHLYAACVRGGTD